MKKVSSAQKTEQQASKPKHAWYWQKEGLVAILLLTFISLALDYWRSRDMPTGNVPPLVAQTIQGETIDLFALSHHKPVMVYFWATWCPACKFVSPTIDWMSDRYEVVTIATSSGDNRVLKGYMQQNGYTFRVINDHRGELSREWGISATPSVVFIKDGDITAITTGISTPPGLWLRMLLS